MLYSQDVNSPGQWIRQWRKFSQGLAECPILSGETIFRYGDQNWVGLPFDPRRAVPGYIQPYDSVFCWSRPRLEILDQCETLNRRFFQSLDLHQYVRAQIRAGGIKAGSINRVVRVVRPSRHEVTNFVCHVGSGGGLLATGLALPLAVHEQRVQQLAAQGYDMRPDWPDVRADQYIP